MVAFPALASSLGLDGLWLKDDGLCAPAYGGNKVRKLEFTLARALAQGYDTVCTIGAVGSHHCLATAIHGGGLDLHVRVLHVPQPINDHVKRNILAIASTGAELKLFEHRGELLARMLRERLDEEVFWLPAGGSSPVGALGYVNAALELAVQIREGFCPVPDTLYVPAGTLGTLVGLWIGLAMAKLPTRLVGVRVIGALGCNDLMLTRLARQVLKTLKSLGARAPGWGRLLWRRPRLLHSQYGEGYGVPTLSALAAQELLARHHGPPLETTYTAKTLAGLLEEARSGRTRGQVMFWNTLNQRPLDDLVNATPVLDLPSPYRSLLGTD